MRSFQGPIIIVAGLLTGVVAWRLVAMLGILDRRRLLIPFLKAYVLCYVSMAGLCVVIDAFSNLDEFTKQADTSNELLRVMGRFYLEQQLLYFDRLGLVVGVMAAVYAIASARRDDRRAEAIRKTSFEKSGQPAG